VADVAAKLWQDYFQSIKTVCPWSWVALRRGSIDLQPWQNYTVDLRSFEARIYTTQNLKPRHLKKITKKLNQTRTEEEWLWSHPRYQNNSTPVPVLIQQDRSRLQSIRQQIRAK
jgi:hypothetical protein